MMITFDNDNDVIAYELVKIIAHARRTQQIFATHCVWWLASIIGLEPGLIRYIDNLSSRVGISVTSEAPQDTSEQAAKDTIELRQDQVLKECEEYLKESRRLRDIASLKSKETIKSGRINSTPISKKLLNISETGLQRRQRNPEDYSPIRGIDKGEISTRKAVGECLRCAWPSDGKGNHRVKNCHRQIKLDKGTANFPKAKDYQRVDLQEIVESRDRDSSTSESSSDDSL